MTISMHFLPGLIFIEGCAAVLSPSLNDICLSCQPTFTFIKEVPLPLSHYTHFRSALLACHLLHYRDASPTLPTSTTFIVEMYFQSFHKLYCRDTSPPCPSPHVSCLCSLSLWRCVSYCSIIHIAEKPLLLARLLFSFINASPVWPPFYCRDVSPH